MIIQVSVFVDSGQHFDQGCNDSYSLWFDSISIIAFRFRLFRFDYVNVFFNSYNITRNVNNMQP